MKKEQQKLEFSCRHESGESDSSSTLFPVTSGSRHSERQFSLAGRELFFWLADLVQVVGRISCRLVASGNNRVDDTAKLFRVPMFSGFPPLLQSWVGDEIAHCPLDLAPQGRTEHAVAIREIHCLEIFEEAIEERAESDFGHS